MGDGAEERVATDAGRGEGHRRVLCGGKRQITSFDPVVAAEPGSPKYASSQISLPRIL
jgi:hypothetical protein